MSRPVHRLPRYGTVGLLVLLLMETAIFCQQSGVLPHVPWPRITAWATPVCWWGYLLALDAWNFRQRGTSWFTDRRPMFVGLCLLSIAFWCLFEAYNRVIPGWQYLNLEPHLPTRLVGYAIAFATIGPGLFITCEWLQGNNLFRNVRIGQFRWSPAALRVSAVFGALCCFVPPFCPPAIRSYLWGFVWIGWFFLLEPFNYRRGAQSIFRDWERGQLARTLQLFAAGIVCGLLWEFWNMWAFTKWIYIFPFGHGYKYFEMPLIGFLGFLPFALDYFVMFHFVASLFSKEDHLGI